MNNLRSELLLVAACVMAATPAFSGPIVIPTVDGVRTAGEYEESFTTGWYNGHNESGSQFQQSDGFVTDVWYRNTADSFYLYVEAPVEAKNMIWGTGVTEADALAAYQHWCSPPSGTLAELDGSNCAHHDKGYEEFLAEKTDFRDMTGSEKVIIADGYKADLDVEADDDLMDHGLLAYMDSVDFVTNVTNGLGCSTTNCDANTTPMSFEFRFENAFTQHELTSFIAAVQSEELEFHLSPELGGASQVPEPGTLALLSLGLAGLGFRKRQARK